jgi:hypothetical protein
MTIQMLVSNPLDGLGSLLVRIFKPRGPQPVSGETETSRRAERDLINEVIWSNPEAFSSGLDVEYFMSMRGRR